MSFVDDVLEMHKEMETPKSFWMWSALCTLSAVVKDQVWLSRAGAYNLYPNIYVILYADSGLKKGPAINLAKDLVKRINNTKIISGRSSIQGILKKLGTAQTAPGGKVEAKSWGFICSSELSSSLVDDPAALTILTDLYDRNYNEGEWESLLKMETFQLRDPTVQLFGGINDAHAEEFFAKKDIQGGLIARTFIIHEKIEHTINPLIRRIEFPPDKDKLTAYLKQVANLKGPFKEMVDENNKPTEAGLLYEEWYYAFRKEVKEFDVKDPTGTLNRFGDSVLKVAMLLALSRRPVLEIEACDVTDAIAISERLLGNVRQATMSRTGLSESAALKGIIIRELLGRDDHRVSRAMLMKKLWLHFSDQNEFDEIMLSFDASNMIKTENIGNQIIYKMPDGQVEELKKFYAGKLRLN